MENNNDLDRISAAIERFASGNSGLLLSPNDHRALAALLPSLLADAHRYRAVRNIACETDKAKQERMLAVIDAFEPPDLQDMPTPEQIDAFVDQALLAIGTARDANG